MKTIEDLQQVKIALDMEIEVFRSLLDVEEERLDINNPTGDRDRITDSLLLSKETTQATTNKLSSEIINNSSSSKSSSSEESVTSIIAKEMSNKVE